MNPDAYADLRRMAQGFGLSRALMTAAELGVADQLAGGPLIAATLADRIVCDGGALARLLRTLANHGVLERLSDDRYALNALAQGLRADDPDSLHAWLLSLSELAWLPWAALTASVRSGAASFPAAHGTSRYQHLAAHPAAAAHFDAAMAAFSRHAISAILAAIDFSGDRRIADLGGGDGTLIGAILRTNPAAHGVLFEREDAIAAARGALDDPELRARLELTVGDFSASVPTGADTYILKDVLHNWDDETALTILRNCAAAMDADARLLLIEPLLAEGGDPLADFLDLHMLVMHGGRERSLAELEDLLARAGLSASRSIGTSSGRIVEAHR